jgi:hypothetical protein
MYRGKVHLHQRSLQLTVRIHRSRRLKAIEPLDAPHTLIAADCIELGFGCAGG